VGVIPPDEYADNVTDSVYTNVVAKKALNAAVRAAAILNKVPNPDWMSTADALPVLYDEATNTHPEYAGYTGEKTKQADVILLPFPLGYHDATHPSSQRADLDYYASRTDPGGPAMTWGMFCVGYLECGDTASANTYFNRSFANAQEPFLVRRITRASRMLSLLWWWWW
jgi:trehalose/maltose hydrolase-like predicted phosphorylase